MSSEDSIRAFLSDVREGIRKQQAEKDLKATGQSADSLEIQSDENSGMLLGDKSFIYQIYGRGPGKMPPVKSIEDWVKARQLVFDPWAIAKSIAQNGTRIFRNPNLGLNIQEVIDEKVKEFLDSMSEYQVSRIMLKI